MLLNGYMVFTGEATTEDKCKRSCNCHLSESWWSNRPWWAEKAIHRSAQHIAIGCDKGKYHRGNYIFFPWVMAHLRVVSPLTKYLDTTFYELYWKLLSEWWDFWVMHHKVFVVSWTLLSAFLGVELLILDILVIIKFVLT